MNERCKVSKPDVKHTANSSIPPAGFFSASAFVRDMTWHINDTPYTIFANDAQVFIRNIYEECIRLNPTYSTTNSASQLISIRWCGCFCVNISPYVAELSSYFEVLFVGVVFSAFRNFTLFQRQFSTPLAAAKVICFFLFFHVLFVLLDVASVARY